MALAPTEYLRILLPTEYLRLKKIHPALIKTSSRSYPSKKVHPALIKTSSRLYPSYPFFALTQKRPFSNRLSPIDFTPAPAPIDFSVVVHTSGYIRRVLHYLRPPQRLLLHEELDFTADFSRFLNSEFRLVMLLMWEEEDDKYHSA
ncbi:unnamed protein product [Lactuca virosa]|uniref:Uncharacterized protein n=1 Tax=Lactuca virosa TaxID=75947 RepID=A0AAU9PEE9_9ASTR|nr:unnamed protein product [Lactuca virosa]